MNTIAALLDRDDYGTEQQFLNFCIDGQWLDEKLDELYPGNNYKGLIPTLDFALATEAERKTVWGRIAPDKGKTTVCPLLMCPDDVDFTCTLVVAEIQYVGEIISWQRLGLDHSKLWEPATDGATGEWVWKPQAVGTTVEWFSDSLVLEFDRAAYFQMLDDFNRQFALEKAKWE